MSTRKLSQTYLLHVCCAPCASASVERLLERGERVTMLYSNANIYPEDEYQRRLDEVARLAEIYRVPLVEDAPDHRQWLDWIAGTEAEPERGSRCSLCFRYSLLRTRDMAQQLGIDRFSTTLTISPHKNSSQIFSAAEDLEGFVPDDFKKKNGYARSIELSRIYDLYRQCYCGCEFSMR